MKIDELKSQLIENYEGVTEAHKELHVINEAIIEHQKEHIVILENHVAELRQIIEKYLLKTTPDARDNNTN